MKLAEHPLIDCFNDVFFLQNNIFYHFQIALGDGALLFITKGETLHTHSQPWGVTVHVCEAITSRYKWETLFGPDHVFRGIRRAVDTILKAHSC